MRGISKQQADENAVRYRSIYDKWLSEDEITLEQLGLSLIHISEPTRPY